jgi:8-oxo-dGTP pyrophosphatase MutT (NUDIX family)
MATEDPKKAAKALILSDGKYLLLLRSAEEDIRPSDWDIPGGGIEPGETEQEAMVREVKEESGIDLSSCQAIPIKRWEGLNDKGIKISGIDFLCTLDSRPDVILSFEHVEAR